MESKLGPLGTSATHWPIVPAPGDCEDGEFGGMNGRGNRSTREKTCPDATLSTTKPTWPDPGLNPGRRGGKPATNRFSYGAAKVAKLMPTYLRPNRNVPKCEHNVFDMYAYVIDGKRCCKTLHRSRF
jgi:hypothetical protein